MEESEGRGQWLELIGLHGQWLQQASSEVRDAAFDPEAIERALARWERIGREELGRDLNLHSLLAHVRLTPAPTGTAADARLRRRLALSEAAFGAVLRVQEWQKDVLYLCRGADGMLPIRLHARSMALLEDDAFGGSALDAAKIVVSAFIAEHGLSPSDKPIPAMEEVQRRSFEALRRDVDSLIAERGARAAG